MKSSTPSTEPVGSQNLSGGASEDKANHANRELADRMARLAVEGLNRLAREKVAETPPLAA